MFKRFFLVFTIMVLMFLTLNPLQFHANPALAIRGTSQATKIIFGIAEKSGIKMGSSSARNKVVQRINYKYENVDRINDLELRNRYQNYINTIDSLPSTPVPDKPGFSKVLVDTAMIVTGLDIVEDIANEFREASINNEFIEGYDNAVQNGDLVNTNSKFWIEPREVVNFNKKYMQYILYYSQCKSGDELRPCSRSVQYGYGSVIGAPFTYYIENLGFVDNSSGGYFKLRIHTTSTFHDNNRVYENTFDFSVPRSHLLIDNVVEKLLEILPEEVPLIDPEMLPDLNTLPDYVEIMIPDGDIILQPVPPQDPYPQKEPKPEEPKPEPIPELPKPEPAYIPNPDYRPDVVPSVDNPKFIPNPDYKPDNPIVNDPTRNPDFNPITGEINGEPIPEIPSVEDIDLVTFFLTIENAFNKKYPVFSDIASIYDVSTDMCDKWDGIKISGLKVGNVVTGESTIVNSVYTNAVSPNLKFWISGIIWFLLGLYIIHKISSVLGAGK